MIRRTVSEQLQHAILSILKLRPAGEHQDYWAFWETEAAKKTHGCVFTLDDLRWAFEDLMQHKAVELTKPDTQRKYAIRYVMCDGLGVDWRTFFLNGQFNVMLTRSGIRYLHRLSKRAIRVVTPVAV